MGALQMYIVQNYKITKTILLQHYDTSINDRLISRFPPSSLCYTTTDSVDSLYRDGVDVLYNIMIMWPQGTKQCGCIVMVTHFFSH